MILPNPLYLYAGAAALAIAAFSGYKVRDWQCDAALANALERAERQRQEMQDEVDGRSTTYEVERDQTARMGRTTVREIRTIYQEVPAAPVDCEPPVPIVGLLEGSVSRANASASGEPSEQLP
jgi:hypothetical protein